MPLENHYAPPTATLEIRQPGEINRYPGYGRFIYLILSLTYVAGVLLLFYGDSPVNHFLIDGKFIWLVAINLMVLYVVINVYRLRNIGASSWLVLLIFVPVIGYLLQAALFALPKGYADHRKLDAAAIAVIFVHVSIALTVIAWVFL